MGTHFLRVVSSRSHEVEELVCNEEHKNRTTELYYLSHDEAGLISRISQKGELGIVEFEG